MQMSPVADPRVPYVPAMVLKAIARRGGRLRTPEARRNKGAVLFADISGFTSLAERLAATGAGPEGLTRVLNGFFGKLVTRIHEFGGDVVKFAGDAVLATWSPDELGDLMAATREAVRCASDLQSRLHGFDAGDGIHLTMRIAVGTGRFWEWHIGGQEQRWEYFVVGEATAQLANLDRLAPPGNVVVSKQAWAHLGADFRGEELLHGARRLVSAGPSLGTTRLELPPLDAAQLDATSDYLPQAVEARLAAGQQDWLGELRAITSVFINLPEFDESTPLPIANKAIRAIQKVVYKHGGTLDKLSVDDKGASVVVAFGVPPNAHADDPVRAVRAAVGCARALDDLGKKYARKYAIGVATGRAYCGVVGSHERREYTIIGNVVNRAARLMQASLGEVLCDATTARNAAKGIRFETLAPVVAKGLSEPLQVFRPDNDSLEPRRYGHHLPIIGRRRERSLLADQLEGLPGGRSGCIVIEGEAGIGKSRLVLDLLDKADELGFDTLVGWADGIEQSTPYFAWRPIVAELFGVTARASTDVIRAAVVRKLLKEPDLGRLAPLLNAVLPTDLPDNDYTSRMEGQVRGDNLHDLIVALLHKRVEQGSVVLVLEDTHWLDAASWQLAKVVAREVSPLLIALVSRPMKVHPEGLQAIVRMGGVTHLSLAPLEHTEALQLVRTRLGTETLPPEVARLIQDRAEGHPFFSEELAYALRDAGHIVIDGRHCRVADGVDLDGLTLPMTLEGVVNGRIDQLPPEQQLTLKAASVIGREFSVEALTHIHPTEPAQEVIAEQLAGFERLDLLMHSPEHEHMYVFRQIVTAEVAYKVLLLAQRRELHHKLAEYYEAHFDGDLDTLQPTLAHHWDRAGVADRAIAALERAGELAVRGYANRDARTFLRRALHLAPPDIDPERRSTWERQLGEACFGLGDIVGAREHHRSALEQLGFPMPAGAAGQVFGLLWHASVQLLHRWLSGLFIGRGKRVDALRAAARSYERLTEVYYMRNDILPSVYGVFRGLNLAESAGPCPELVRAYANTEVAMGVTGMHYFARVYERHLLATDELVGDEHAHNWSLTTRATYEYGLGNWVIARELLDEARAAYRELGDWSRVAYASLPRAWVAMWTGEIDVSTLLLEEAVHSYKRHGNDVLQVIGLAGRAVLLLRQSGNGPVERAAELMTQAESLHGESADKASAIALHGVQAAVYMRLGRTEEATDQARRAVALTSGSDPVGAYLLEGYAAAALTALALMEREPGKHRDIALQGIEGLRKFTKAFPIGGPRHAVCCGLLAKLDGDAAAAGRYWAQALETATALGMPYDASIARDHQGTAQQ